MRYYLFYGAHFLFLLWCAFFCEMLSQRDALAYYKVSRRIERERNERIVRALPLRLPLDSCATILQKLGVRTTRDQLTGALARCVPDATPNGPLNRIFTVPGAMKKGKQGPNIDIAYLDPGATATVLAQRTQQLWPELRKIREQFGNSTMGLYLYCDGVTGGNILNAKASKQGWIVNWPIAEFGHLLQKEEWWFPLIVLRSLKAREIDGGLTTVWMKLLEVFFSGGRKYKLAAWNEKGEVLEFRLEFRGHIQDEAEEMKVNSCKGASGNKPCLKCSNLVRVRTGLERHNPRLVNTAEHRLERLQFHTNETIHAIFDELRRRKNIEKKRDFDELQIQLGFTWHPLAPLAQPWAKQVIRTISQSVTDTMHTYVASDGLFNSELVQLMAACEKLTGKQLNMGSLARFINNGAWSSVTGTLFTEAIVTAPMSAGYCKIGGSECLAVFRIVSYFCETCACTWPDLQPHAASMQALCWLMELALAPRAVWKHTAAATTPAVRGAAASRHLQLFKEAYPGESIRHKNHQSLHCALQEIGLNCFVGERKNKRFKNAVGHVHLAEKNAVAWSQHLLQRILLDQMELIDASPAEPTCLDVDAEEVPPTHPLYANVNDIYADMLSLQCSLKCHVCSMPLEAGQVVLAATADGEALFLTNVFLRVLLPAGDAHAMLAKPLELAHLLANFCFVCIRAWGAYYMGR